MKKIILITLIALFSITTFAQTTKVGTADTDFILSKMPELIKLQADLELYNKQLQNQLKNKIDDYEKIFNAAEIAFETMSDQDKNAKQQELAGLENDIAKFRNNGSQLVDLKQDTLLRPLYRKIGDNIAIVAKELGYTQILNTSNNVNLAYIDPAHDISSKVIAKMGIVIEE